MKFVFLIGERPSLWKRIATRVVDELKGRFHPVEHVLAERHIILIGVHRCDENQNADLIQTVCVNCTLVETGFGNELNCRF
ncbi:hypothetical protein PHO31112_05435 [Pandoraea horticolens]|uniref:Uncharacterized protein n=1 Tax=Pandoraea horticolens TaxID=2508298 RepID=A0A5E4ZD46_9BURK|nr:hypothetical protein PHO31112_05435 [Pandoraea horticolens]